MDKLLSFAIPCYNSAEYMEHCINTVIAGGDEVEVIIVDDGSTKDNTYEIAKRYEQEYPEIVKAVHQENGGHGDAVNTGLKHATGKFFKVVDSDDWVDSKSYKRMLATLRSFEEGEEPDMVIANYVYEKVGAKRKKVIHYENVFPVGQMFSVCSLVSCMLLFNTLSTLLCVRSAQIKTLPRIAAINAAISFALRLVFFFIYEILLLSSLCKRLHFLL